jgi:hypothetical protein
MEKSPRELLDSYFAKPPYPIFAIRRLIDIGDASVIPFLELAFERETDNPAREFLAAALVELGDREPTYYAYIANRAERSVSSDMPFPVQLGSDIPPNVGLFPLRSTFLAWVNEHGTDLNDTLFQAVFEEPGAVEALGEAADVRSRPIFLHGLKSSNVLIAFSAALGLARLQDSTSVPFIIATAKRHQDLAERRMFGKALLYFRSERAQHAADKLIADPTLARRWRLEVDARGWKKSMRDSGG